MRQQDRNYPVSVRGDDVYRPVRAFVVDDHNLCVGLAKGRVDRLPKEAREIEVDNYDTCAHESHGNGVKPQPTMGSLAQCPHDLSMYIGSFYGDGISEGLRARTPGRPFRA